MRPVREHELGAGPAAAEGLLHLRALGALSRASTAASCTGTPTTPRRDDLSTTGFGPEWSTPSPSDMGEMVGWIGHFMVAEDNLIGVHKSHG